MIGRSRIIAVAIVVFVTLLAPAAGTAGERYVLDWDSGTGKSYVIAAAEIVGFAGALNAFDRLAIDSSGPSHSSTRTRSASIRSVIRIRAVSPTGWRARPA